MQQIGGIQRIRGIQHTEGYTNKPLMCLILRVTTDQINTIAGTGTIDEMNTPDQQNTSSNPTASTTTLDVRVNPVERITGAVEQTIETERCGSTSTQLVQLPTHSNIPGVSMVRNTGDSEYHSRNDEPEEILRRLEQQVRDLLFIMEAKLYWPAHCGPDDDRNVIDGLENILIMKRRLFQIVLSLKGKIRRLQRARISRVMSAQEAL